MAKAYDLMLLKLTQLLEANTKRIEMEFTVQEGSTK